MDYTEGLKIVKFLKDYSTGTQFENSEKIFIEYREILVKETNTEILKNIPAWLLRIRDITSYWSFISKFSTYAERRSYLDLEFDGLLSYLEFGNTAEIGEQKLEDKEMKKIFISHSSIDKEYAEEFIELLSDFGINHSEILCTSVPGTRLQVGTPDFLIAIKEYLIKTPIFICLFSENYLKSPICLCEMGAAWIASKEQRLILTPETEFELTRNIVLGRSHGTKINDSNGIIETLENLQVYFGIPLKNASEVNRIINKYLKSIKNISEKKVLN